MNRPPEDAEERLEDEVVPRRVVSSIDQVEGRFALRSEPELLPSIRKPGRTRPIDEDPGPSAA